MHRTLTGMDMSTLNLLTCEDAAVQLGISPDRVRQFCREGRLGQRLGDRWVIPVDEVKQFSQIPRKTGRPSADEEHN